VLFGCLEQRDPVHTPTNQTLLQRVEMEGNAIELFEYDNEGRVRIFSSSMFHHRYQYDAQGLLT
jgi:hypothetical protein